MWTLKQAPLPPKTEAAVMEMEMEMDEPCPPPPPPARRTLSLTVHMCTKCKKIGTDPQNMKRHTETTRCNGALLYKFRSDVDVCIPSHLAAADDMGDAEDHQLPQKPGPKKRTPNRLMHGRAPTRDGGDDARIDVIFADEVLLRELMRRPAEELPEFLFLRLWSRLAPTELRSVCLTSEGVIEVSELNEDTGDVRCTALAPFNREYVADFTEYILDFARVVCSISIPARLPEASATAATQARKIIDVAARPAEVKLRRAMKQHACNLYNM